jgi:urease accessory protein
VADSADVRAFAMHSLAQCGRTALPIVTAAHSSLDDIIELGELCDVFLSNPVANRASRAQGRALLTSVARAFPDAPVAPIEASIRDNAMAGHYPPLFGGLFSLLDVNLLDTQRAFLFIASRGVSSAAVRLGIIGAYDAQTIQAAVSHRIDAVIRSCEADTARHRADRAPH